jgi:hypothetical protein
MSSTFDCGSCPHEQEIAEQEDAGKASALDSKALTTMPKTFPMMMMMILAIKKMTMLTELRRR